MAAKKNNKNKKRVLKYSRIEKKDSSGNISFECTQLFCWHQAHEVALNRLSTIHFDKGSSAPPPP
jgi:hypothetical protein